jgi:RNA polymerase sigma factor (sigma-70 family)
MTALEGKALLDHGKAIARRYAGRVGGDVAEDLGAEAVLRALGSPPPDGRIEPWLERIYRNLLVDLWRRRHPTVAISEAVELAGTATPEEEALRRERRRAVRASLRGLPREARRALLSRFYGELDDDVAAIRFGVSTTTVRTRVHRALARLRAGLGHLRAWCPPLWGKLGAQAAAIGLAPVMVAALVLVAPTAPPPSPPPVPTAQAVPRAQPAPASGWHAAQTEPTSIVTVVPQPRARSAKRASLPTITAASEPSPSTAAVELAPEALIVGHILEPEGLDVFVEPEKPVPPCMVAAPPDFVAQIEKMVEERL